MVTFKSIYSAYEDNRCEIDRRAEINAIIEFKLHSKAQSDVNDQKIVFVNKMDWNGMEWNEQQKTRRCHSMVKLNGKRHPYTQSQLIETRNEMRV